MRVLHVLNTSTFSGAENVVCQIIKMFEEDSNIEMAYTSPNGPIRDALAERGIIFIPMEKLCYSELKRVIKAFKPDVIHGHDIRGAIYASRFTHYARIIHTIHGNDLKMRKIGIKAISYAIASMKAEHVFWVSNTCLDQYVFRNVLSKKSSVLYNVVDSNEVIRKSSLDDKVYDYDAIFIRRIAYPKNPQKLIKVFSLVVNKVPSFKAAVVGNGNLEDEVKKLASQYRIEKM